MATPTGQVPLSNVNYDLLTILQNKLKALAAYDAYQQDCQMSGDAQCQQLVAQLKRDDQQHVELLRQELERIVRAGQFH
jgi:hypothetical protein